MTQIAFLSDCHEQLTDLLNEYRGATDSRSAQEKLAHVFRGFPETVKPDGDQYADILGHDLYRFILKHYRGGAQNLCLWRFIKKLRPEEIGSEGDCESFADLLYRAYLYSGPLDDLTCLFVPLNDSKTIAAYLDWIRRHFYDADYPTSLLWLYALDSAMISLFPDELIYLGRRRPGDVDVMVPDYTASDAVLIKRYSDDPGRFVRLEGRAANEEFRLIHRFLQNQQRDRCLSHSVRKHEPSQKAAKTAAWEKFEDVLRFGVSDRPECGCVSFSDMRASTEFLTTYGKSVYLNKIQQPFFEKTKLISKKYNGRIDKFMGDNVMCVFFASPDRAPSKGPRSAVLNNFLAVFELCGILYDLIVKEGFESSRLGLRSGVTFGEYILRSNLGNEFVRDFTVTGETVNLAARLEHITIHELRLHNEMYFKDTVERFPKVSQLLAARGDARALNSETRAVVERFALYQNIDANLERLNRSRFDIRFNELFYKQIRDHFTSLGHPVQNRETADIHGYEEYEIDGCPLKVYFMYNNPKGFADFERIWMLPLEPEVLKNLDIENLRGPHAGEAEPQK